MFEEKKKQDRKKEKKIYSFFNLFPFLPIPVVNLIFCFVMNAKVKKKTMARKKKKKKERHFSVPLSVVIW